MVRFLEDPLLVVKLGGSLHDHPVLPTWLRLLAAEAPCGRLLVPGGGPFADAVRNAQRRCGFSDLAAHRMAILAMQQYGLLLHDLCPALALVEEATAMAALRKRRAAAIWMPWRLAGLDASLAPSWKVTSDTIALWLARKVGADMLLLVKRQVPQTQDATELAHRGILDAAFPGELSRKPLPYRLLAASDPGAYRELAENPGWRDGHRT